MARRLGKYDGALQMFAQEPVETKDIDIERLNFLRWLMIQKTSLVGDGWVMGASTGEIVDFVRAKAEREQEQAAAA